MKHINIVFKIILPLVIGLFLIAFISVYSNFYLLKKNITDKADERFEIVSKSLDSIIKQDTMLMLGLMEQLEKDQKIINFYKQNDRESLYNYLLSTYKSYNKRYDITHFYIHKINKQNFIRMHNKDKHSDFIDRATLGSASKNLKLSSGIEFGILHNLTLRVVLPWFVNGKLIGYIELGKEIDKLTPRLAKSASVDIIFSVKKELLSKENFEKWKNNNRNRHYETIKFYYIIDSTIDKIDEELEGHLDENGTHKYHAHDYVNNGDSRYFIHSKPFYDVNNKNVGNLYILIDIKEEYGFLYELLIDISIIMLILLAFLVIYYFKFLQKKEKELNEVYLEIQRVSITDGLTDIYNKRHYLNNAPYQINNCSRCQGYISFILIDVDEFKKYNDYYGHLKGDDVLIEIAKAMKAIFKRALDCSYRVGGEEFLVVTSSQDSENGYKMAEHLRKAIYNLSIEHKKHKENIITVSIGVCTKKSDNMTKIEELYDNADKALYESKNNGRNQVSVFKYDT